MNKHIKQVSLALMMGAMSLTVLSCADKDSQEETLSGNGNISIRSVRFVDDDNVIDINSKMQSDGSIGKPQSVGSLKASTRQGMEEIAPLMIQTGSDFDFIADVSSTAIAQQGVGAKASVKGAAVKAADIPMNPYKKFRLVFIADGSTTPIYNQALNAGENPDLRVSANAKYRWYAFSINETTVPDIDGSGSVGASALANKDFMFASGEITTKLGENYLDILFLRQMAAVEVKMNTRGLFGGINDNSTFSVGTGSGTSFTNIIQTGNFSIYTGAFSGLEDVAPVNGAQMTVVDNRWGKAEKIARFYTANTSRTIAANNLRVRLNGLNITLDDNTTRSFSANTIVPIAHSASLNLTKGTLSKTNVRLIESGVVVSGLVWARTNLVYDVNKLYGGSYVAGRSDAYRFRTNNSYAYPNLRTEYWNFGATTPAGTDYRTEDPCRRVYPEMTWRLPHENNPRELTRLSQNTNRVTSRTTMSDGTRHSIVWTASQPNNPAYPDNNLVLSAAGFRDANGSLQQNPSGSSAGSGTLHFRSGTFENNAARNLYAEVKNGNFGETSILLKAFNNGITIRCVRQVNNN